MKWNLCLCSSRNHVMMFVGADIQFEMFDVFVDLPDENRS